MPAIITNAFRTYNADNFISAFSTNKMYLMIGKADSWSGASLGQYTESSPSDTAIPVPIDTTLAPYIHHNDMIAAKLINESDVSHVIKRTDWVSGTVYAEYSHLQDDQIDQDFFVMTDQFNVYKCISNYGGAASTTKPTGQTIGIFDTPDNYRWKFMYEVQQADVLKYVTTDWIPVKYLTSNDGTAQWTTQQAAVDGALEHIDVTSGGTGYVNTNTGTALAGSTGTTIVLAATASTTNDIYNGMTVYISSGTGSGQIKVITDYVGSTKTATVSTWTTNPDTTSVYEIMPAVAITDADPEGSGTGAAARCSSVVGGVIKKIAMTAVGSGWRMATAVLTGGGGTGCVLEPRIGPKNRHGKNAKVELGGAFVMMNVRLVGTEGGDFATGDDFRKVILIANPLASGAAATATTYTGAGISNELDNDSGQMIYVEYRAPINRASDQTEDVKLVVEF